MSYERPPNPVPPVRREDEVENEIRPVWTTLMEEMLIHYIRANRLLWDPNHPLFTRPAIKRRKVQDIAAIIKRESGLSDEFIICPEDVWRKFRNLRTYFVREVRKVNESKRQPNEETYESKWVHFSRMLFLVDSLKKSIESNVPLPGVSVNPATIKMEGSRSRLPVNSLSSLNDIEQQHQEAEDELRIGGEWMGSSSNTSEANASGLQDATTSYVPSIDRNCDSVISSESRRGGSAAKRAKLQHIQEKKMSEVTESFGRFVTASIQRLSENKQHELMAKLTQCISEYHNNK